MAQQEWRVGHLLLQLDQFLSPFLTHPYHNVRERLGSVLANLFSNDFEFDTGPGGLTSPRVHLFIDRVLPHLEIMKSEPDPELYNFHKTSGKSAFNVVSHEEVLKQLPADLAKLVQLQG